MAVFGFPSVTPGSAVEAFQRQEYGHLDSQTRTHMFTGSIAIGNPKARARKTERPERPQYMCIQLYIPKDCPK